jgi:hypothetical protein
MRKGRIPVSPEMIDKAYRFGVVPNAIVECIACGALPTLTGHVNFPSLWLFKSSDAALKFRQSGECQHCQMET